ncbi:MAG: PilZ domain-containing protein [Gammaproteobacteria bacterium]
MTEHIQRRRAVRLAHKSKIRYTDSCGRTEIAYTRDFSDTGMYIISKSNQDDLPSVGSELIVQSMEIEQALAQKVRVVRIEPGAGFGVEFLTA